MFLRRKSAPEILSRHKVAATVFKHASALRLQLLNAGFCFSERSRGELAPTTLTQGVYVFAE